MDLLTLARGPILQWSLIICAAGILWRLTGILLLRRKPDYSEPRNTGTWLGALKLIVTRSWPKREFWATTAFGQTIGYVFHVGLVVVIFGFAPHILFIKSLVGVSWPNLPNSLIYATGGITIAALVAALIRRVSNPVLRLLSNFDDYFSWLVTVAPVVTGLLAAAHLGARYETLLAIHILSVCLLLVWLPFGKLMHSVMIFVSRGTTGALFARKGAST
ncbi:nitrate reductase [Acidihalobacter aeolianus]|uniref:Nitrate reductase n=1 Tax=Acidihalobacter aeolianus TaxID=2792603 RepID=A0A1D8K6G0_9GAMM|nr:nitrate reductase [Acidihalobacter aeolianus]AOV16562.1 nitrate reductase [Acidihalobacter aeolianus]